MMDILVYELLLPMYLNEVYNSIEKNNSRTKINSLYFSLYGTDEDGQLRAATVQIAGMMSVLVGRHSFRRATYKVTSRRTDKVMEDVSPRWRIASQS